MTILDKCKIADLMGDYAEALQRENTGTSFYTILEGIGILFAKNFSYTLAFPIARGEVVTSQELERSISGTMQVLEEQIRGAFQEWQKVLPPNIKTNVN